MAMQETVGSFLESFTFDRHQDRLFWLSFASQFDTVTA
jgi:hypothetical protein